MTPLFFCLGRADKLPTALLNMHPFEIKDNKLNLSGKCVVGLTIGDVLIVVTSLVVGILGALRVLRGIPPAASYSLIALAGIMLLSWSPLLFSKEERDTFKTLFYTPSPAEESGSEEDN